MGWLQARQGVARLMQTFVVGVSGGVDSVVLLDMMRRLPDSRVIVAHFDHGIRDDSKEDAIFVGQLAQKYGLAYHTKREELGRSASEELARNRRYKFLREIAKQYDAKLVTAHHADDMLESVAINLLRGTGWRGLAVMGSDVLRPLSDKTKANLLEYALTHKLEWREDSTNFSDTYLRNRVRRKKGEITDHTRGQVKILRDKQLALRQEIEAEAASLIGDGPDYSRYFFIHAPVVVAIELLRHATKAKLTRPQLERTLLAIKVARPGNVYQAGAGVELSFTTRYFLVKLVK